jgi:hypothetical protein
LSLKEQNWPLIVDHTISSDAMTCVLEIKGTWEAGEDAKKGVVVGERWVFAE